MKFRVTQTAQLVVFYNLFESRHTDAQRGRLRLFDCSK